MREGVAPVHCPLRFFCLGMLLAVALAGCSGGGKVPAAGARAPANTSSAGKPPKISPINLYEVKAATTPAFRFGPAQPSGPDFVLGKGQTVTMLRREFGYSQVMTQNGESVYVPTEDLLALTEPPARGGSPLGPAPLNGVNPGLLPAGGNLAATGASNVFLPVPAGMRSLYSGGAAGRGSQGGLGGFSASRGSRSSGIIGGGPLFDSDEALPPLPSGATPEGEGGNDPGLAELRPNFRNQKRPEVIHPEKPGFRVRTLTPR
jgi:hypothetical protein